MQTRRTNLDHHHQEGFPKEAFGKENSRPFSTPEAELIALARSKGRILAEKTLRLIRETLELRGVALENYVETVRPHFRNAIHNPSGFLINFARNFATLSRPAAAPPASKPGKQPNKELCDVCKGQRLVIQDKQFEPCPKCSTPEYHQEWQQREADRERRARACRNERVPPE
jgi:hypothetical protein